MFRIVDPLDYLRKAIQQNKNIIRDGEYLIFEDGVKLPLNAKTALISQSISKKDKDKHFTLGSLWLFLKFKDNLKDYINEVTKQKIEFVENIDRDKILDYFMKNIDNTDILDNEIRSKTLITLGKKNKGENLDLFFHVKNNPEENKKKEKYYNMIKQQELKDKNLCIMDYIYSHQKKSLNRNALMKPPENTLDFGHLISMTKKIFTSEGGLKEQEEAKSFLDELIENNEGLGMSKLIIVVPSTFTEGNLCDKNAKAFLHEGKYINLNQLEEGEKELLIDDDIVDNNFNYKIQGKDLMFEICSNVRKFNKSDWKRVVAVFVQGDDWEFSDWPRSENPSTILQKVKGYYMKYNNNPTNKNIKKWNVQTLEISRNKRHFDVSIQNKFWSSLSEFLSAPRKR